MIHLPSFESYVSPDFNLDEAFRISIADALTLKQAGFDALLIENFHDSPFPKTRIYEQNHRFSSYNSCLSEYSEKCVFTSHNNGHD